MEVRPHPHILKTDSPSTLVSFEQPAGFLLLAIPYLRLEFPASQFSSALLWYFTNSQHNELDLQHSKYCLNY